MAKLRTTIINKFGTMQGWNSITMNMMFRDVEGISKIQYDDNVPKENVYGAGGFPIGRSAGNYEPTFSFELFKEEDDALQGSLPPGGRVQDIAPSDVIVEYERADGTIQRDIARNMEIVGRGRDITQNDGTITVPYTCIVSHIDWNV